MGTEYEYMKLYDSALTSYQTGLDLALLEVGNNHPLTLSLENHIEHIRKLKTKINIRHITRAEKKL